MKVLIGTTNPSKVRRFEEFLDGFGVEFYTLKDLEIQDEPEEMGNTPEENAILKAKFYGQYFDYVICNDSGLYFDELPLDDSRQPGLNIRTPKGVRLNDEEMITYYGELVHSLGGKVLAYYLDGIAVYNKGEIYSFMEGRESAKLTGFYMVDKPSDKRHEGWPLDSLSLNRNTMMYFVDKGNNVYDKVEENIMIGEYRQRLIKFLKEALELQSKKDYIDSDYHINYTINENKTTSQTVSPYRVYIEEMKEKLSHGIEVRIFDEENGKALLTVKDIKDVNQLKEALDKLPREKRKIAHVSIKADKDTPMEEITAIKKVLREYYIYQLNMEVNKTIDNGEGTLYQQQTTTQKKE